MGELEETNGGGPKPPPPLSQVPPHQIDWYGEAACVDTDAKYFEIFFPPDGNYGDVIDQAAQVCQRCPAYDKCHTWAVNNPRWSQHGIWAATTPRDRETIRERRRRTWRQRDTARGNGAPDPP